MVSAAAALIMAGCGSGPGLSKTEAGSVAQREFMRTWAPEKEPTDEVNTTCHDRHDNSWECSVAMTYTGQSGATETVAREVYQVWYQTDENKNVSKLVFSCVGGMRGC